MNDKDRIASLEHRIAALEARLAAHPYIAPWDPLHPFRVTCRAPEVPVSCSGSMEVALQSETFRATVAELEAIAGDPA